MVNPEHARMSNIGQTEQIVIRNIYVFVCIKNMYSLGLCVLQYMYILKKRSHKLEQSKEQCMKVLGEKKRNYVIILLFFLFKITFLYLLSDLFCAFLCQGTSVGAENN